MNYSIITGAENFKIDEVMSLLATTYWAQNRPKDTVLKSMQNSVCCGIRLEESKKLVGFARVISDFATTYYICDVVVDEKYRKCGFGKALISHIENSPEYKGLRGVLITRDAHGFYEKFGYKILDGRAMVKGLNC